MTTDNTPRLAAVPGSMPFIHNVDTAPAYWWLDILWVILVDGRAPEVWSLERQPFFLETSVAGSFAAGDVRHGSVKRVASAIGEGAMAVTFVHQYLSDR